MRKLRRHIFLMILGILGSAAGALAQQTVTVTGKVLSEAGDELSGTTIIVEKISSGNRTFRIADSAGLFTIPNLTAGERYNLYFDHVGYKTDSLLNLLFSASENNTLLVRMQQSAGTTLDEVVVTTALGIKRTERSLTYSVQQVDNEDITKNKDANFVNSLSGKLAGVSISPSSSGIGGATRVVMRGTKSIAGNNNVLYVIDGMPMPNTNGGAGSTGAFQGVVSGEGISSINPDDIESISALTGPSASALYGNQGANGVILITTRKGTAGDIKVRVSNNTDFFSPFVMPRFQNTYGQADPVQFQSWGAKLDEPSKYNPKDFFQTGFTVYNGATLSGGSEKSQTLLSLATNNSQGIISKNTYDRYNIYLRNTTDFTDRWSADFSIMYVSYSDKNMIAQGQYHNPLLGIYLFPPGDDIQKYQIYTRYDPNRKISTQFWPYGNQGLAIENPYWIINDEANTNQTDRYMLSAVTQYKVNDWFNISGRARMDNNNSLSEVKRAAGTDGLFASEFGYYTTAKSRLKSAYLDILASINKRIGQNFHLNANLGGSYFNNTIDTLGAGGKLSRLANFYSVSENTVDPPTQGYYHSQLQSTFATAELEYNRWLFLNLTGRYEWPSELPKGFASKSSYFYPSVGISGVLTDAFKIYSKALSYAKVRLSYAEVGTPPGFGITNPTYSLINPDGYRPAPFPLYLPERTKSFEAGIDAKFFRNKLSLSATVYQSNTTSQLLDQQLTTGGLYTDFYFNAGNIENRGIEATLGYDARLSGLKLFSSLVFTLNRNKIKRLSEGFENPVTHEIFGKDSIRIGTIGNDLLNILRVGGTMADLYVTQLLTEDNQGNLWIDPGTGAISKSNVSPMFIGRTTPDFTLGWRNNLNYGDFDLSFLIDGRFGGMGISYTQAIMDAFGVSEKSADERNNGGAFVYGKKYGNVQSLYNMIGGASGGSVGLAAYYVYQATNIRLREASFGYTLPGRFFNGKIDRVRLALVGRNLFMFYNKSPFDPESTSSTGTYYQGIDYFRQPSYRSYGFSVNVSF